MRPTKNKKQLESIAREVHQLRDQDEALSKARVKTKVEQRDVRLRVGELVADLSEQEVALVAKESGYTTARLGNFAFVYKQWPKGSYPEDISFTPLEELARHPDRFSLIESGMSKRDARAARGGRVDTPSRWSPEVKMDFIKEALADPAVARQVASDASTRSIIARAENDLMREDRTRRDADPSYKVTRQAVSGDDIVRRIVNARYDINRALDQAMEDGLTDPKRQEALEALAELTTTVDWFRSYLESGDTSFEQALEALLSEEN